jgi:hypothetical protein
MKEKSPKKVKAVDLMNWRRLRVSHMFFMALPPSVLHEKFAGKGATYA